MFNLILTNGEQDLVLQFIVRNTEIAKKWYTELKKNYEIYEDNRFTDWGNQNFVEQINHCIDVINKYQPIIDMKVTGKTTQKDFNYLHKFFENLRGEITERTEWFDNAPDDVKFAVERFNILIHHLETEIKTKGKHPTIVVTFKNTTRIKLIDEDLKQFTFKWERGGVYINYCQVGKTVLDVFKNNDDLVEAIRPQTHYSADFMVKFGEPSNFCVYFFRKIWLKLWLLKKQLPFTNLNIGMIPVADLVTNVSNEELIKFNKVKSVKCIK